MRTATWNAIGTDVSTATNVMDVLKESKLDYEVSKSPILLPSGVEIPDRVATVKDDGSYIGVVSKSYQIYQNKEAFDFIDNIDGITFTKAGETGTGMVYIIGKLPDVTVMNDTFTPYMIFQTSHNGRYNIKATICPLRIVCQNQFNFSFKQMTNTINIRHSRQLPYKVAQAQKLLQDTAIYMQGFSNTAEELALLKLRGNNSVYEIIDKFFESTKELTERQQHAIEEKKEAFIRCYNEDDNTEFRGTVWGALNAFADYNTHRQTKKTERVDETKFMKVTFDQEAMNKFMQIAMANVA